MADKNTNKDIKEIKWLGQILDYVDTKEHLVDLFNYITNLQEENERLKEQCKEWKENHKAVCIQRDNILDNIVKDTEDRIDYKSRIDKAIEYCEDITSREIDISDTDYELGEDFTARDILKILRGEDNGNT